MDEETKKDMEKILKKRIDVKGVIVILDKSNDESLEFETLMLGVEGGQAAILYARNLYEVELKRRDIEKLAHSSHSSDEVSRSPSHSNERDATEA